jgi:hypothetical protein
VFKSSTLALCLLSAGLCTAVARADDAKPAPETAHVSSPSSCLRDTGTLMQTRRGECALSFGHSYSKAELDRTGKVSIADALRTLEPSLATR